MSVTVFLANQGFTLPATNVDDRRREAYFKNPSDPKYQLVPEEDKILLALGIDKQAFGTLKKEESSCLNGRMAEFFKQLPKCQSDSSLMLAKDCEVVHCVLWETLLAAQSRSKDMYKDNWNNKKPWSDISVAINSQILNDLKPKRENLDDMDRLFTLIMKAGVPVASPISALPSVPVPSAPPTPADVNKLFTLIVPGQTEENPQPAVPSPPESTTGVIGLTKAENAASAITAPSVTSNSSTSFKSLFTRKTGKTPFTKETTQVNFNRPATQPNIPQATQPNIPQATQPNIPQATLPPVVELTRPLDRESLEKAQAIIENQCGLKNIPAYKNRIYESPLESHKRCLYFWHSIKNKTPINLTVLSLPEEQETQFLSEWTNTLKDTENLLQASQQFLGIEPQEQTYIDHLFLYFEKGGPNANFLKCTDCAKLGESWAGDINRFLPRIGLAPDKLQYLLENIQWNAAATEADVNTPKTVDDIGLFIMDEERYDLAPVKTWFTIITNHDIDYSFNKGKTWNYSLQGSHIHESHVIHDLFESKTAVLDIHPWLMYLLNKERDIKRPVLDGSKRSIYDWFLNNAFNDNYSPVKDPRLSLTKRLYPTTKEQLHVAYYVICHAIANANPSYVPAVFYSQLNYDKKLPLIVGWLRDKNTDYTPVEEAMKWVAPRTKPLTRIELANLFEKSGKQTLKNKYNASNKTRSWKNNVKRFMPSAPTPPPPEIPIQEGPMVIAPSLPPSVVPPILPSVESAATAMPQEEENLTGKKCKKEFHILYNFMIQNRAELERMSIKNLAEAFNLSGEGNNKVINVGGVIKLRRAMAMCHPDKNGNDKENTTYIIKILNGLNDYDPDDKPTTGVDPKNEARFKAEERAERWRQRTAAIKETLSKGTAAVKQGASKMFSYMQAPFTRKNKPAQKASSTMKKNRRAYNKKFQDTYNRSRNSGMSAANALKVAEEELRAHQTATPVVKPSAKYNYGNKKPNLSGFSSNNPPPPSNSQREEYIRMARNIGLEEGDAMEAEKEAEARVKNNKEKYNKFLKKTPAKQAELLKKLVHRILQRKQTELLAELNHPQEQEYTNEEKANLASLNEEIRREQSPE